MSGQGKLGTGGCVGLLNVNGVIAFEPIPGTYKIVGQLLEICKQGMVEVR